MKRNRLTKEEQQEYEQNGYLLGLPPVFDDQQVQELNTGFETLKAMLYENEITSDIAGWHQHSKWLYDICATPQILDYVEDILGPNFFLWGSEFITKPPQSDKVVPWHQDAYYWALHPHNSVTVWLAFTEVDVDNGAMKVIPRSHKGGIIKHRIADENSILSFDLEEGSFSEDDAVSLEIRPGGISLHDDAIIHGSPANHSDRWRIGCVMRYSSTEVKADTEKNPKFRSFMMRGQDQYKHNPQGVIPTERFARPEENTRRIRKTKQDVN